MKKKTGSKLIIIILLTLTVALVLLPEIAFATNGTMEGDGTSTDPYNPMGITAECTQMPAADIPPEYWPAKAHTHTIGDQVIDFQPWTSSDSLPTDAGNYYLTQDVTISSMWSVPAGETNLCLNGHGIIYSGSVSNGAISIFSKKEINKTLNLFDCGKTEHYITLDQWRGTEVDAARELTDVKSDGIGVVKVTGGFITGAIKEGVSIGGGDDRNGIFNMYGGTIIGNNSSGVLVTTFGEFHMAGGSITDNTANAANGKDGGGVWVSGDDETSFTVSGVPEITGNKKGNTDRNVYLAYNSKVNNTAKININGPLTGEDNSKAKIGVTMSDNTGVFTDGWNGKMGSTSDPADYFFSDNSDYGVTLTTGENPEAQLLRSYPLNYDSNGGSGSMTSQSVYDGDTFTFPECTFTPPRNKTLDHWKMSGVDGIFQPSQQVTITSNCVQGGAITVTAYWKDCAPYQQTERDIQDLPPLSSITLDNKEDVLKAMDEYNNLSSEDQKKIAPELVDKLMKAYDKIQVLIVEDIAGKLPSEITLNDEDAVNAAVEAYLALTEAQKELFSPELRQRLADAEDVINKGKAAAITTKVSGAKNLKGGKVRMYLGKPHHNAVKGKGASVFTAQKVTGINGFCIQYSTDKKFKKKVKTKTITDPSTKSATIGKLKKGKNYYFRVCTYTKVTNRISSDTVTVNGKWSAKKRVKITK